MIRRPVVLDIDIHVVIFSTSSSATSAIPPTRIAQEAMGRLSRGVVNRHGLEIDGEGYRVADRRQLAHRPLLWLAQGEMSRVRRGYVPRIKSKQIESDDLNII